jgi:hydrogenase-4 component B
MNSLELFAGAMVVLSATSVLTLLTADRRALAGAINFVGIVCASIAMLWLAGKALITGPVEFALGGIQVLGLSARMVFRIDGLSALFIILITVLTSASALYGIGYLEHYKHENLRRYYFPFPLFMAGMLAVVAAADWFWFLVFWEFMTLASYFLVVFENEEKQNLSAGFIYFFMTHLTSAGLMIAVIFLSNRSSSFAFTALPEVFRGLAQTSPAGLHALLFLFFIAFATKAGMYPLGIWLPAAHPAAPASVSALLSGVMIKIGVYGLLRVFVWLLPVSSAATVWGVVIATFGVISMLIGTLRALGEHDCKRLLAQHSIGQMGYVLLGLGLGLAFMVRNPVVAAVALVGCLYHLVNHACFKSLLFFNSGSILYRTGTRDLDELGGLVKVMPLTAVCALVGSLSIAGTPPFNGFVSKWLLYQSAIFGEVTTPLYIGYGIVAIFIGTVTLASFIKYLGTAYLGTLPEKYAGAGPQCPKSMEVVEVFLAATCLLLGLFPALVVGALLRVLQPALTAAGNGLAPSAIAALPWGGAALSLGGVNVSAAAPLIILVALAICGMIAYAVYRSVRVPSRPAAIWNCGELVPDEMVRYRASSFYQPFKELVSPVYRRIQWPQIEPPRFVATGLDLDRWLYFPLASAGVRISRWCSKLHNGVPQFYLLWQVFGLVISIGLVFWMVSGGKQ